MLYILIAERKREKIVGLQPAFHCGYASLLHACVCVYVCIYVCMLCLHERACVLMFAEMVV